MAWVAPKTDFATGNVVTATQLNNIGLDLNETVTAKVTTKGDIAYATGANALLRVAAGANGTWLVYDSTQSAGVKVFTPQLVRLHKSAGQTINSGTDTLITFAAGTEDFDDPNLHDNVTNNSRITIAVAGKYLVGGEVQFAASTAGTYRIGRIKQNGTTVSQMTIGPAGTSATPRLSFSTIINATASQYVELTAQQDSGGGLSVSDSVLWAVCLSLY